MRDEIPSPVALLLPFFVLAFGMPSESAATAASGEQPQLIVKESTVYYPVYGRNLAELMRTLRAPDTGQHSRRAHGLTRSDFRVDSEFAQGREACIVRELTIRLTIRIDLPQWAGNAAVPKALQDHWTEIQERTTRHEARHRQYAVDAANDLQRTLLLRPPDRLCAQLAKAVRDHSNRVRTRWQLRDSLLDQNDILHLRERR